MQKIELIGFIGKDAEIKETQTGKKLASFSLAVKSGKETTQWYNCNFWGDKIEAFKGLIPHLKKGSKIYLDGILHHPTIYTNSFGDVSVNLSVSPIHITFVGSGVESTKKQEVKKFVEPKKFERSLFETQTGFVEPDDSSLS